jgi:hypothetical protein
VGTGDLREVDHLLAHVHETVRVQDRDRFLLPQRNGAASAEWDAYIPEVAYQPTCPG